MIGKVNSEKKAIIFSKTVDEVAEAKIEERGEQRINLK